MIRWLVLVGCFLAGLSPSFGQEEAAKTDSRWAKDDSFIRIATFNVSLNRPAAGRLRDDLQAGDDQAKRVAAVIRLLQPDILLLNEVDYDGRTPSTAELFARRYLDSSDPDVLDGKPCKYEYIFTAPVNTGVPSGLDINQNGKPDEPDDAWGYGRFPGQYGMAVLSKFRIDQEAVVSLQEFLWSDMPGARRPAADGSEFFPDAVWNKLRLSSKSFWDVPIQTPLGKVHFLVSHPTPPAFDGPEDRNGCRNADEIRLIKDYIEGAPYLALERPLSKSAAFVVAGDLNSDANDGGSQAEAIESLLNHPRVADIPAPTSLGAKAAAKRQAGANQKHSGPAEQDTGDFNDRSVGNLRVDYVLPSSNLTVKDSGVFWPELDEFAPQKRQDLLQVLRASDHHLVWVDIVVGK
ncbi:MAG TPA: endonuclease [Planctomycetaceae bacterium]|nr:endonuclease [Planctomycetaceae bacterium]